MKAIIKVKISDRELEIIIESLKRQNLHNKDERESAKLLNDMMGIKIELEKKILEKIEGEK